MSQLVAQIPDFLYGTAWKKERSEKLCLQALNLGFKGIDTANQREHYFEKGVGKGFQNYLKTSGRSRSDFFLQSKFTYVKYQYQTEILPYDQNSNLSIQVNQSVDSTLDHFSTDYIDSLILHGPFSPNKLSDEDMEVLNTMESLLQKQKIRLLGVSNVSAQYLKELLTTTNIQPAFVQNRCFARTYWDQDVRKLCKDYNITYQGFSLLTANQTEINQPQIQEIALKHGKTPAQIFFAFTKHIGMLPITGTCNKFHMQEALSSLEINLSAQEVRQIELITETITN